MRFGIFCSLLLSFCSLAQAAEITLNGHTFTLPDDMEIQLVAGPPLINRPITADFDEQGRLYVSDSSGSNDKVQVQLETRPHRILRLEDVDNDGVFDKSTVFADRMMFPEGTMWYDGSLYVSAAPSIWKFTDADGDGVAEQREEWFQGLTLTGCANDLHGPYLGPDGWIYWCKGAFAEQNHIVHGKPWKTRSSHIFRCRPDKSGFEPVMTGGMDNPVDTVFLPNGDRVFTTTFLVHPGNGQRDGLIHAVYGGVYGKENGALEGHPRTGELMPVLAHLGAAAPCGLTRYESAVFGPDYRDNVFACQFNMHKVSRHVLTRNGASYSSQDSDFVVSSNLDFHPTDVLADADGSLVIVDTGGWYKLCCPTSQLHKPDILGGIYRVSRKGAAKVVEPRGANIDWAHLSAAEVRQLFGDDRPEVRRRALREFAARGESAEVASWLKSVAKSGITDQPEGKPLTDAQQLVAVQTLWALSRLPQDDARSAVRSTLAHSSDELVKQVALQGISLWRDRQAVPELLQELKQGSPMVRRLAAECLGRSGDASVTAHLLAAAAQVVSPQQSNGGSATADLPSGPRQLEHAIIYALIELANPSATAAGLSDSSSATRRTALVALDQMAGGGLAAERVTPLLADADPILQTTADWIIAHHPEWGDQLAGYFQQRLREIAERPGVTEKKSAGPPSDEERAESDLEQRLIRFAANPTIEAMLASSIQTEAGLSPAARRLILRAMANARPKEMPASWGAALASLLSSAPQEAVLAAAVVVARQVSQPKTPYAELNAALLKVAADERLAAQPRLDAMAAVAGGMSQLNEDQFSLILASLLPDRPVVERSAAADAVARARLTPVQLDRLADTIKSIGPLELDRLLAPFERSNDEPLGLKLVASLKQSLALSSLRLDSLQQKLAKYSPAVQQGVGELVALINAEASQQRQRVEELLPTVAHGDIRRGQAVFNSTKSACTACHRFGYLGGNAGPDLTRIGGIRNERDLLESILYPSVSFVRSYEPVVIVTVDGRVINGLIRNETESELVLTTGPNQEARLARADIEELRPSTVSVMPAGLDKQLTEQELADLVAFLKNAK